MVASVVEVLELWSENLLAPTVVISQLRIIGSLLLHLLKGGN
jgi:hypothetical protein